MWFLFGFCPAWINQPQKDQKKRTICISLVSLKDCPKKLNYNCVWTAIDVGPMGPDSGKTLKWPVKEFCYI